MTDQSPFVRCSNGRTGGNLEVTLGCTRASAGCKNCPGPIHNSSHFTEFSVNDAVLEKAFSCINVKTFFINRYSDLFFEKVPDDHIYRVFAVMESTAHTYVVLTKRSERAKEMLSSRAFPMRVYEAGRKFLGDRYINRGPDWEGNLIIGVSAENQEMLEMRARHLLQIPCRYKLISVSPMLGPIDLFSPILSNITWLTASAEYGPKKRPCKLQWLVDLGKQCNDAGVPFHLLKQYRTKWIEKMKEAGVEHRQFPAIITDG